ARLITAVTAIDGNDAVTSQCLAGANADKAAAATGAGRPHAAALAARDSANATIAGRGCDITAVRADGCHIVIERNVASTAGNRNRAADPSCGATAHAAAGAAPSSGTARARGALQGGGGRDAAIGGNQLGRQVTGLRRQIDRAAVSGAPVIAKTSSST